MSRTLFSCSRPGVLGSVVGLCVAIFGAVTGHAAVNVSATFNPVLIRFGATQQVYILGVSVNATGFTNDSNLDNYVRLNSNDHEFEGDFYPARGTGSGTLGSIGTSSIAALVTAINTGATGTAWTLTVTDGVTLTTRTYALNVSTPGIHPDYLRPNELDVETDDSISNAPTFTWTEPAHAAPSSNWSYGAVGLFATIPANNVFSPGIGPTSLSWTPDGPISNDTYILVVAKVNTTPPQTLITATTPTPIGGVPALGTFTKSVEVSSHSQVQGLIAGGGGPCSTPEVSVSVNLAPNAISFSPLDPTVFILGIGLSASGFTDDSNIDNYVKLRSDDGHFGGDLFPARGFGTGTLGSIGLSSPSELASAINATTNWTLTVTDGDTNVTRLFSLDVTTPGIADHFLRPVILDVAPGDMISTTPTFNFTQASTAVPSAQNTSGYAFMIGNLPNNFVGDPPLALSDTSWTPDGPIDADTYVVVVAKVNNTPPQTLVQATTPVPNTVNTCPLVAFNTTVSIQSAGQSNNVVAGGSACDGIDFNGDGVSPDSADIDDFIAVFGGGACSNDPNCGDIDFNNDGVSPDSADIETFLIVFGGGAC